MISITLWRAEIGQFYHRAYSSTKISVSSFSFQSSCPKSIPLYILIFLIGIFSCDFNMVFQVLLTTKKNFLYFIFLKFYNFVCYFHEYIGIHILNERYYLYQVYVFLSIVLFQSGDIEANPGPMLSSNQCLSVFYWNLNSLSVYNFVKKDLLIAFNSIHTFDIICLSETYLDSSYALDNKDLQIGSYIMIRA